MSPQEDGAAGEIGLRLIVGADLKAVHRIEVESYSVPWSLATFRNLVDRPDTDMIAADAGGRVVGYVISWFVVDQGELGNIAVATTWRRRGIGRLLVEAALDRARSRGIREVYLEVRRSNTGAQRLYREFGFSKVGVRRGYYVEPFEDALVMRRLLREIEPA
jgi:ribosomal-protein-alanine N-acetyltransferase